MGRKRKNGRKVRSAEKMEDKNEETESVYVPMQSVQVQSIPVESVSVESVSVESVPVQFSPVESAPVESVLVESVPVHSVPIQPQSKECYPAPSTGQTDQDKHMPEQTIPKQPEQHKPAQLNPAYPSADQHNQARIPSALPSQTPPEHPYLAKLPIPPTTQSEDQPSPDQGSPLRFSPDQPSLDQSPLSSPDEDKPKKKGDANKLSVLTWNIDCLDLDNIKERVSRLLDYLIEYHPDIVLLQEVIFPVYQVLQQVLKPYHVLSGSDRNYFTAILLRKSRVQLLEGSIVNYPSTNMRRNLLMAKIVFLGHSLCVMTSHLESMKSGGSERQNQLRILWDKMMEQPQDHNVIFGGDTNLRDWEVKNLGGLPEGICDVWEYLGQPEDCRYTWDCVTNDNKEIAFPARLRFDRLFFKQAGKGSKVIPDGLTLVGQERLANSDQFTSDHWGLLSSFILEPFSHPE